MKLLQKRKFIRFKKFKDSINNGLVFQPESLSSKGSITPILVSSVLSALIANAVLKDHLILEVGSYSLANTIVELPLYIVLGCLAGVIAVLFNQTSRFVTKIFDDTDPTVNSDNGITPPALITLGQLPKFTKPLIGGLICGLMGLWFPQTLFFDYETLNGLLANNSLPSMTLLSLLLAKLFTTCKCLFHFSTFS